MGTENTSNKRLATLSMMVTLILGILSFIITIQGAPILIGISGDAEILLYSLSQIRAEPARSVFKIATAFQNSNHQLTHPEPHPTKASL